MVKITSNGPQKDTMAQSKSKTKPISKGKTLKNKKSG